MRINTKFSYAIVLLNCTFQPAILVHRKKDILLLLSLICCCLIFWLNASMFESECRKLYLQNIHNVLFLYTATKCELMPAYKRALIKVWLLG
jgi:hypothetical protein